MSSLRKHETRAAWRFLTPFLVLFAMFFLLPIGYAAWQSVQKVERIGPLGLGGSRTVFSGFDNYSSALHDDAFVASIKRVLVFAAIEVPLMIVMAVGLALLLDAASARGVRFFRATYFLPYGVPGVVASILWGFLYTPGTSPILDLLGQTGAHPDLLGGTTVLWSIANIVMWEFAGYNMLVITAQLHAISGELYEAARIDGAGAWQIVRTIKLPLLRPAIILTTVFTIIGTLQLFAEPLILKPVSTSIDSSYTPNLAAYTSAFSNNNYHLAAAQAVLLALTAFILSFGFLRIVGPARGIPMTTPTGAPERELTAVQEPAPITATRRRPARKRRDDTSPASRILVISALAVAAVYFLLPVYWLIIASTKSTSDLFGSSGLWFSRPQWLSNMGNVLTYDDGIYVRWAFNSILYAGVGAGLATLFAAMAGYALAKYRFRGRETIFNIVLGGVLIPSTALALPLYLLFAKLGMANTYWAVLLPSMVSPFGVYLCRIYAEAAVPDELIESARIDGASDTRIFFTFGLRIMSPALVTVFLFQFVGIWNNYFLPLVMLSDPDLYPITLGLTSWQSFQDRQPELYQLVVGGAFISVLPLMVAMVALQRFWRTGLTEGSVKG